MDTNELLSRRAKEYGETWLMAGKVLGILKEPFNNLLHETPEYAHNWVLMLSKLIRILYSPYKTDNYRDLIGYATLCLEDMRKDTEDNDI